MAHDTPLRMNGAEKASEFPQCFGACACFLFAGLQTYILVLFTSYSLSMADPAFSSLKKEFKNTYTREDMITKQVLEES